MNIHELDTPAVLIDLDRMECNIERLGRYCTENRIRLRPHVKTHKIPELARLQIKSGAHGVTVAKPSEAKIMRDAGISDILVAFPIVPDQKARELARLAVAGPIAVSIDSCEAAEALSRAAKDHSVRLRIFTEIDVGMHRCGVGTAKAALALTRHIAGLPGLDFLGMMFYPGHMLAPRHRQRELLPAVNQLLDDVYATLAGEGISIPEVSGGSTPTAYMSAEFHGVTEIRPGMYLFNDRNMLGAEVVSADQCALTVLATVVSNAVPGRAIIDGGSKTFSSDRFLSGNGRGLGSCAKIPMPSSKHYQKSTATWTSAVRNTPTA